MRTHSWVLNPNYRSVLASGSIIIEWPVGASVAKLWRDTLGVTNWPILQSWHINEGRSIGLVIIMRKIIDKRSAKKLVQQIYLFSFIKWNVTNMHLLVEKINRILNLLVNQEAFSHRNARKTFSSLKSNIWRRKNWLYELNSSAKL